MLQRNWLRAAFLISGMAVALVAQDPALTPAPPDYQPGQVIKVTPHYSRWNYPKEIVLPEGTQLHIVETGDTLWDLGSKYLGNPFAWPQIWEMNQWVVDPHWIHPVDHLVIPIGRTTLRPGETPSEINDLPPGVRQNRLVRDEYGFTFQDALQLPYLAPKGAEAHFKELRGVKIVSQKPLGKTQFGDLDTIYVDGGSDNGLKLGDRVLALKVLKRKLYHPSDVKQTKSLGDVVKQIAVARVTQVQPKASVAVIEKSADSVQTGDYLVPFSEPANMTLALRTDIEEPIAIQQPQAHVMFIGDNHAQSGTGTMVIIDKGEQDGMRVGNVLLSVRERTWPVGSAPKGTAKTNYLIAQMLVVKTTPESATCRILRAYEEVKLGDIVTR